MPETTATLGWGTRLYIADESDAFTDDPVAQLKDVPWPEFECDDVDITNMDSPDATREFIAGISDGGEVEFEMIFKTETVAYIDGLFRKKRLFRLCFPRRNNMDYDLDEANQYAGTPPESTPRIDFSGYIKKRGGESPVEDAIMTTVTVKVSSKPVFTTQPADA